MEPVPAEHRMELIANNKYWCFKQSVENESYGECAPHRLWQGILKVYQRSPGAGGTAYQLHRLDHEGRTIHDPNAYAMVQATDLFNTEEDAKPFYQRACKAYAEYLMEKAEYYVKESGLTGNVVLAIVEDLR